jgi:hypothetical protein
VFPLKIVVVEAPFKKLGLDFIGDFKDKYRNKNYWVLIAIEYFTRWV